MSAVAKEAGSVAPVTILFFQNLICLTLFAPSILRHGLIGLRTDHLPLHLLRAIGGLLSQALMFIAIARMPLMNAVLLSNAAPLFIPIVAWVWLGEQIKTITTVSLLIGFVGVLLILHPSSDLVHDPIALIAITASIASAISLVTVNQLARTDTTHRILFYYFALAALLTAPLLPAGWHPLRRSQWLDLIVIGLLQACSQLMIVRAYRYAKPAFIAPFNYSTIIFSGIIGWLVWNDRPGIGAIAGVLLVCAGGAITTFNAGPNARGHFGWIGHFNALWLHQRHRQKIGAIPATR